jgi:hypothetical protein
VILTYHDGKAVVTMSDDTPLWTKKLALVLVNASHIVNLRYSIKGKDSDFCSGDTLDLGTFVIDIRLSMSRKNVHSNADDIGKRTCELSFSLGRTSPLSIFYVNIFVYFVAITDWLMMLGYDIRSLAPDISYSGEVRPKEKDNSHVLLPMPE